MNILLTQRKMQLAQPLLFLSGLIMFQCARVTTPTGGPKDEIPPVLISSNPGANSTNFKEKEIKLTFSEYIQVKNPKEEILSNPDIGEKTVYLTRKNQLIIKPEKKLLENTTYSINFRGAVSDMNESLPAENLRLAFSTGPIIDSLQINGQIFYLGEERKADNVTVALYAADTFNIFKHRPAYVSKTDKKGRFSLQNLKPDKYCFYAFEDKNKNLRVDTKSEYFDFTPTRFHLQRDTTLFLSLFKVNSSEPKVSAVRNYKNLSTVSFNKPLDSIKAKLLANNPILLTYGDEKNELVVYHDIIKDSIKLNLQTIDSLHQKMDTTVFIKSAEGPAPKTRFKVKLNTRYSYQTNTVHYTLNYNKPVTRYIPDSCYVGIDSTFYKQIDSKDFKVDTLYHQITGSLKLPDPPKAPVQKNTDTDITKKQTKPVSPQVTVSFKKGAFISLENDSSGVVSNKIKVLSEEDCGSLKVEVVTKAKHYILYLMKDKEIITTINSSPYTFTKLEPGSYKLQLLIDENNDGKWNPGNYFTHKKAEQIYLFKEEDTSDLTVRANWEIGPVKISSEVIHTIEADDVEEEEKPKKPFDN